MPPLERGRLRAHTAGMPTIQPAGPVKWYHRPVWVLVLLFGVLGPLGLPYLWGSPRFGRALKVLLTVAVLAYTALLVNETIRIGLAVREEMHQLQLIPEE